MEAPGGVASRAHGPEATAHSADARASWSRSPAPLWEDESPLPPAPWLWCPGAAADTTLKVKITWGPDGLERPQDFGLDF